MNLPIYSICICNYNMENSLHESLCSVLDQLDDRYEVLVIDDGSSDRSLKILSEISKRYPIMRFIPLERDRKRRLGETRNISVKAANGKYVLLHIDTDDMWESTINSFVKIFHEIQKRIPMEEFLLSGNPIQMANRDLILRHPYKNVYYTEDRILWNELSVLGKLICIENTIMRKRMPFKNNKSKVLKILSSQFSQLNISLMISSNLYITFKQYLSSIFLDNKYSKKIRLLKFLFLLPLLIKALFFSKKIFINQSMYNYRKLNTIDLNELENQSQSEFGLFKLSNSERKYFKLKKI